MKKIEVYLDCVSPYSYHALTYLLANRQNLASYSVKIEVIPVFLGGIMQGSGNNPPWQLDAKAKYAAFDGVRAQKYFKTIAGEYYGDGPQKELKIWATPSFFPILSLLPQRILTYLKQSYPQHVFEQTFLSFFHYLWSASPQLDLLKQENVVFALKNTYDSGSRGTSKPIFTSEDVAVILRESSTEMIKSKLKDTTEHCWRKLGAFGCPWFWVINDEVTGSTGSGSVGKEASGLVSGEPFFGSDRWQFMYDYLDVPYQDIRIFPPGHVEPDGRNKEILAKL